jgi:hypothetical protein
LGVWFTILGGGPWVGGREHGGEAEVRDEDGKKMVCTRERMQERRETRSSP